MDQGSDLHKRIQKLMLDTDQDQMVWFTQQENVRELTRATKPTLILTFVNYIYDLRTQRGFMSHFTL